MAGAGVELRRSGRRLTGLCPFHEDRDPSLVVYPHSRSYFCFACDFGGDVIDFVGRIRGTGFRETAELLAGSGGAATVPAPAARPPVRRPDPVLDEEATAVVEAAASLYAAQYARSREARSYLRGRGVDGKTAMRLRIGFAGGGLARHLRSQRLDIDAARRIGLLATDRDTLAGRIVIPDLDASGRATWLTARSLEGRGPRYLNLRLPSPVLGLEQVRRAGASALVLTEGPFDWLAAVGWQLHAAALLGTHVSREALGALRSFGARLPRARRRRPRSPRLRPHPLRARSAGGRRDAPPGGARPRRTRMPARWTRGVPGVAPASTRTRAGIMDGIDRERPAGPGRLSRAARTRLKQPLPPELVSERTTEHGEVLRYIEGWRAIEQANAVFGHDRWGAELVGEVTCRELPGVGGPGETPAGVYTATVRVTADGCRPHSDVGTAVASDATAEAHTVACKAAVTDALKRALRHFGERFGNGLSATVDGSSLPAAVTPDELRRRVLEIAARAGADETRTRAWIEQRYGRPLESLTAQPLLAAVDALSRGLHRRNGAQAA